VAEDRDNKTEPATPRRRQEARESGQVARSADLTSSALLVVGLLALSMTARTITQTLAVLMQWLLGPGALNASSGGLDPLGTLENDFRIGAPRIARILVPLMLSVAGTAVIVLGFQVGFHVTTKPLMPSLAKLNPIQGIRRLFAGRAGMQLGMNLAKLTLVGAVAWSYIRSQMPAILSVGAVDFPENFNAAAQIVFDLAWRLAWSLLILAALDWFYQRWHLERDLKMSKQEIKDEAKRMEGDQEIKGKRRQFARKMIMQRIHRDVPKADVVVTNPTELAIALQYDPEKMGAPRVVAKGAGFLAARIRQIAIANGVPILERKPLAQALYKTVDVGQEVPAEFYQAIAEILAYVYELAGKGARRLRRAG
jgi:flagellar biosynthesis protein FlhB